MSATSSNTTRGLLPPSSRDTRFRLDFAAACMICLPTSVEPVNATLKETLIYCTTYLYICAQSRFSHFINVWMQGDGPADSTSESVDHVQDPFWESGLLGQVAHVQRAQRGQLGRLEHNGAAGGQGRRYQTVTYIRKSLLSSIGTYIRTPLPGQHPKRVVPRDDLSNYAHRLLPRVGEDFAIGGNRISMNLVSPAGAVTEISNRAVDVEQGLSRERKLINFDCKAIILLSYIVLGTCQVHIAPVQVEYFSQV